MQTQGDWITHPVWYFIRQQHVAYSVAMTPYCRENNMDLQAPKTFFFYKFSQERKKKTQSTKHKIQNNTPFAADSEVHVAKSTVY